MYSWEKSVKVSIGQKKIHRLNYKEKNEWNVEIQKSIII
jgi:hypothetical protein